jgi:hypothetical protein
MTATNLFFNNNFTLGLRDLGRVLNTRGVGLGHNNRFRGGLAWHRRKLKSKKIRVMMQDLQV